MAQGSKKPELQKELCRAVVGGIHSSFLSLLHVHWDFRVFLFLFICVLLEKASLKNLQMVEIFV